MRADQSEQDITEADTFAHENKQDTIPPTDEVYEEAHIPYLPLPVPPPLQVNTLPGVTRVQRATCPSSSEIKGGMGSSGTLLGGALCALIGVVLSLVMGGNVLLWAAIGAVVGGVIVLLPEVFSGRAGSWILWESFEAGLSEAFSCCQMSAFLVIASGITISGLLIWQNVFLAIGMGASIITMLLLGWSIIPLKHFLAKGTTVNDKSSIHTNKVSLRHPTPVGC